MKAKLFGLVFGMMISLSGLAATGGGFVFVVDSISGDVGTQVSVPVRAMNFDSIISFQGTVGFDTSKLDFVGVGNYSLPSMGPSNFGTTNVQNGQLTFSWNETSLMPITIPDSSILFEVTFLIIGQPGTDAFVKIQNVPTIIEVVNWTFTPIGFSTEAGNVHINALPGSGRPPVLIFADSVAGNTNSVISLPIRAKDFDAIVSMQGSLQWDPLIADFQTVNAFGLAGMNLSNFGIAQASQGELTFSWNDASLQGVSVADSAVLFALEFSLIGQGGMNCDLEILDLPLSLEFADTSLNVIADSAIFGYIAVLDTMVGIDSQLEQKQLQIYPNPVNSNSQTFYLNLEIREEIVEAMELLKPNGMAFKRGLNWEQNGTRLVGQIANSVPAGLYLMKVATTRQVQYLRIIVDKH